MKLFARRLLIGFFGALFAVALGGSSAFAQEVGNGSSAGNAGNGGGATISSASAFCGGTTSVLCGAFYRTGSPPPFGAMSATAGTTAPSPYPTYSGAPGNLASIETYLYGTATNGFSIDSANPLDAQKLKNLTDLGLKWVRQTDAPALIDNSLLFGAGSYSWGQVDAVLGAVYLAGITPAIGTEIGPVEYNDCPATGFCAELHNRYDTPAAFATYCTAIATHASSIFGDHIYSIPQNEPIDAIGNPDGPDFLTGSPPPPVLLAVAGTTLQAATLALTPSVYYRMNETTGTTATDSSGSGLTGTYTGTGGTFTFNFSTPGITVNDAAGVTFNEGGTTGSLVTAAPVSTGPLISSALTTSVWIKTAFAPSVAAIVANDNVSGDGDGIEENFDNAGHVIVTLGTANGIFTLTSTTTVAAGQLAHIVFTYDGANMKLYINDGTPVTLAATGAVKAAKNAALLTLGNNPGNAQPIGDAQIQEFALFPSALTAAQVATVFHDGTGGVGSGYLVNGTNYQYRVAALIGGVPTLPSAEYYVTMAATTANGAMQLTWGPSAAETGGYEVFGRTAGSEQLIGTTAHGVTTFTDVGIATPSGALPTTSTVTATAWEADLAAYMKPCYQAIKAADPLSFVYGFEMNITNGLLVTPATTVSVLKNTYSCGPGTCYDGIAAHIYPALPVQSRAAACGAETSVGIVGSGLGPSCLDSLETATGTTVPIMLSETAITVPGMAATEAAAATAMPAFLAAWAAYPNLRYINYANVDECAEFTSGFFLGACLVGENLGTTNIKAARWIPAKAFFANP